jgi:formylglycine-generating enzyme required for sulfatase activity
MSADPADLLRALARDHLEGRSSLESYRRRRAQLLNALVPSAAGASPEATQPRAAAQAAESASSQARAAQARATAHPAEVTQPRAALATAPADARPSTTPPSQQAAGLGRKVGYGTLALVLAIAVGFLVWRHHLQSVPATQAAATSAGGAESGAQTDPIRALLEPLLESPDWSDARLLALNESLLEAGRARIDAVRDTEWFDAVIDSVRSRLLQQQALANAPLTPDRSPLAALAVTLGIDLSAIAGTGHVAAVGAQGETSHPTAAAAPVAPRVANAAPASAHAKTEAASTPEHTSAAASAHAASAPEGSSDTTRPASTAAASAATTPPAAAVASASTPAPTASQKSSVHHEYPACSAALSQVRLNYCQDLLDSGAPAPLLVVLPSGSFMMGNSESAAESPVHRVTLAHGFAMSAYEVSQSEYERYCRTAGTACPQQPWTRGDDPVVNVSWRDAEDYAKWLSAATHERYRLPTEAEWEYAARAGRTGLYPSGDTLSPTDAYFSMGATLTAPAPRSMRFNANAWHLMHMVGNVREWVEDAWNPTFAGAPDDGSARLQGDADMKVVRGGCYADAAIKLRLTTREALAADTRDRCTGIRLVREIH